MFKDADIFASFSVNDIKSAKEFYGQTLGLELTEVFGMLQLKPKQGGMIVVYPKKNHTPASYTVLNFPVKDIEQTMDQLAKVGIVFEVYTEGDTVTDERGVSTYGTTKAAWFKDPANNLLALLEGM